MHKLKQEKIWIVIAGVLLGLGLIWISPVGWAPLVPIVHAQGQSAAPLPFTVPYQTSASTSYVLPACTPGLDPTGSIQQAGGCIPNSGQVADEVSYNWTSGCGSDAGYLELDGANDAAISSATTAAAQSTAGTWFVLAVGPSPVSGSSGGPVGGMLYSNGYFTYKRIVVVDCATGSSPPTGKVSGVYQPVNSPIPVNPVAAVTFSEEVNGANQAYNIVNGSYAVTGFSVYNPNSSVCYLRFQWFSSEVWGPFGVPATSTLTWSGPAAVPTAGTSGITLSVVTTAGGSTGCTSAMNVNLTVSQGPFYPVNPISAL